MAWPRPPWAALVALVGVLIARGLFDVPLLAPTSEGTLGDAGLAGLAAAAALLATGLMHLLLVSTPPPGQFFSWIMVLATLIARSASGRRTPRWPGRDGSHQMTLQARRSVVTRFAGR